MLHYSSAIISPTLAGALYGVIGLVGIWPIDLGTFAIALIMLLCVTIPNPKKRSQESDFDRTKIKSVWQDLNFGIRYIRTRLNLLALLAIDTLFKFVPDLGAGLYSPMILTRTGNDAQALGTVSWAAGLGGVLGAAIAILDLSS